LAAEGQEDVQPGTETKVLQEGSDQILRADALTLYLDEHGVSSSGDRYVEIKLHAKNALSSPPLLSLSWAPTVAGCSMLALNSFIHSRLLEGRSRGREEAWLSKITSWYVYWTERHTGDETTGFEGNLNGPVESSEQLWDVIPLSTCLHVYPNDGAGAEQRRLTKLREEAIVAKVEAAKRSRASEEKASRLSMSLEEREAVLQQDAVKVARHAAHVRFLEGLRGKERELQKRE